MSDEEAKELLRKFVPALRNPSIKGIVLKWIEINKIECGPKKI